MRGRRVRPCRFGNCTVELTGDPFMFVGVREADWVVTVLPSGKVSRVGKVLAAEIYRRSDDDIF